MRYQVQMWIRGEWDTLDSANTLRMAGVLAACIEKQWAQLGARLRVFDADEQRPIALEAIV